MPIRLKVLFLKFYQFMKKYLLILLVVINLKVKSQETIIRVHKITDELICQGFVLKSDSSIYHGAFAMFFEGKK